MQRHSTSRQQFVRVCECGCGEPTLLAPQSSTLRGWVRDQPLRYITGHNVRGDSNSPHRINDRGYIVLHLPDHPIANKNGYLYMHRLVAFEAYGPLPDGTLVHHINGIKDDNRPENLAVMSVADHTKLHQRGTKRPTRPPLTQWSKRFLCCRQCGTSTVPYAGKGLCRNCHAAEYRLLPARTWGRLHACCIDCGTTSVRHAARGRCHNCDMRARHHAKSRLR